MNLPKLNCISFWKQRVMLHYVFVYSNLKFCLPNLINFCLKMTKELGDRKQLRF